MIYKITEKENKTASTGTPYIKAKLVSEEGETFLVNAFNGEFSGETWEGTLEKNGEYWNLPKIQRTKQNTFVKKDPLVVEAVRNENIVKNMDIKATRTEQGIAYNHAHNMAFEYIHKFLPFNNMSENDFLVELRKMTRILYKDWETWDGEAFH